MKKLKCNNPACRRNTYAVHANGRCSHCFDYAEYAEQEIKETFKSNKENRLQKRKWATKQRRKLASMGLTTKGAVRQKEVMA